MTRICNITTSCGEEKFQDFGDIYVINALSEGMFYLKEYESSNRNKSSKNLKLSNEKVLLNLIMFVDQFVNYFFRIFAVRSELTDIFQFLFQSHIILSEYLYFEFFACLLQLRSASHDQSFLRSKHRNHFDPSLLVGVLPSLSNRLIKNPGPKV